MTRLMVRPRWETLVMSERFVLDNTDGRQTDMEFEDNKLRIKTSQDVSPILNHNKRKFNDYGDKLTLGKRGEWHHAASIPKTTWERWLRETNGEIARDSKLLAAYLNNPDYKYFKTAPTNL